MHQSADAQQLVAPQAVYDPSLGSGTCVIAAETCGRACFGAELDPAYVDVIMQRGGSFTGQGTTLQAGPTLAEVSTARATKPTETEWRDRRPEPTAMKVEAGNHGKPSLNKNERETRPRTSS